MAKVLPWQRPSSAPSQGAPGGSGQLGTPRASPATGTPATALQLLELAAHFTAFGHPGTPYVLLSNTGAKPFNAVYDKLTAPGSDFECRPDGSPIPPGRIYTAADAQVGFMLSGHLANPNPNPKPNPNPNPSSHPNPYPGGLHAERPPARRLQAARART